MDESLKAVTLGRRPTVAVHDVEAVADGEGDGRPLGRVHCSVGMVRTAREAAS